MRHPNSYDAVSDLLDGMITLKDVSMSNLGTELNAGFMVVQEGKNGIEELWPLSFRTETVTSVEIYGGMKPPSESDEKKSNGQAIAS